MNGKATVLLSHRIVMAYDAFAEIIVWKVPKAVSPSEHSFKYRLAYVVKGRCVLRYDNERGKGDHRHYESVTIPYAFSSPEQLMLDYQTDIQRWNRENGRA